LKPAVFCVKFVQNFADTITNDCKQKKKNRDPRKPTYLLVQKPINEGALPKVFATCGGKHHDDGKKLIPETVV
jgi:hypothetical protein